MLKWGHFEAFLRLRGQNVKLGILNLEFNVGIVRIGGPLATSYRPDLSAQRARHSARTTAGSSVWGGGCPLASCQILSVKC